MHVTKLTLKQGKSKLTRHTVISILLSFAFSLCYLYNIYNEWRCKHQSLNFPHQKSYWSEMRRQKVWLKNTDGTQTTYQTQTTRHRYSYIWVESKSMHICQISCHFTGSLQTLILTLILERFLRNLREMSRFSSESDKILFIRYRVSKKYGGKRLKMTHRNRK